MPESLHITDVPVQMPQEQIINIEGLKKSFGSNHVLTGFDLQVQRGENVIVLGRSGSGKSVLIKCIVRLVEPDAGKIEVLGQDILGMDTQELNEIRHKIGFLFQSSALYDSMTVQENLLFQLRRERKKKPKEVIDNMITEALENVGLLNTVDMMPSELSGGMRKRIGLARTIVSKPEIILYDEPTTGLDPITAKEIIGLMLDLQRQYNTTSIIISHDMKGVKMINGRIIMLIDGKAYAEGSFEELKKSRDPNIRPFFE